MNFSFNTISRAMRSLAGVAILAAMPILSPVPVTAAEGNFLRDRLVVQVSGQRIQGEGMSLVLPVSFYGGNPRTTLGEISEKLSQVVPDSEERLTLIRNSPLPIVFLAFDSAVDSAGFLTNVNVVVESVSRRMSVEEYLQGNLRALSAFYEILESDLVSVNEIPMGRIVARQNQLQQLFYLIPRGDRFYVVTYSSSTAGFSSRLPIFERSMQTFRFQ